ncbi:MAG: hypothetical protein K9K30_08250 [Burkholderiaceae bacterium]|nr:hypothetical protein [Burkholderiaceae bacterium]MCF8183367.1 hypothetical protein [Polynucleobacter sp.]
MFSTGDGFSCFSDSDLFSSINPASGLPMIGDGIGGVDVAGNPWGCDGSLFESSSISSWFDW